MIKYLLLISAALIIVLLLESEREKRKPVKEYLEIETDKIRNNYKLIFISDLHDRQYGKDNNLLLKMIREEKPDYILIGGDLMIAKRKKTDLGITTHLLNELSSVAPVIYANGNHEQRLFSDENKDTYGKWKDEFLDIISKNDVSYLSDSYVNKDELVFYGLNLDEDCYKDLFNKKIDEEYINSHIGKPKDGYNILMAHNPLYLDVYEKWGADLGLCGHFHGGVMRIGKRGVLTSQWQLFHKWCAGDFEINNSRFIVSRGLGGHTINVRINNYPELRVIKLIGRGK